METTSTEPIRAGMGIRILDEIGRRIKRGSLLEFGRVLSTGIARQKSS